MTEVYEKESWQVIEELVAAGEAQTLQEYLETLQPSELARGLSRLTEQDQASLLAMLEPGPAARLLEEFSDTLGADLVEELEPEKAAAIIDEMDTGHRVDLLAELEADDAQAILSNMDPEEARDARQLLTYPENTAGGIMVTEFLAFRMSMHVSDVLQDLRENADLYSDYGVQYAYVVNDQDVLIGVIRLRDLVLSKPDTPLTSIMIANPLYFYVDSTLEEMEDFFDRYVFVGAPVTDHHGRLVGVVRRADAEEAFSERAEQTYMRLGGIIGGEEYRSSPLGIRAGRRLAWLLINLGLSLVASSVILKFEATIASAVALVFFIPVIANMSGCSGNQAVAVSIRDLSSGLVQPRDFMMVLWKELQAGLIIGLSVAVAIGIVAAVMYNNPYLGVVIGSALGLNTIAAMILGGLIPLALRRIGLDPALAAPLVLMTLADMLGFLLVLGLAALFLSLQLI